MDEGVVGRMQQGERARVGVGVELRVYGQGSAGGSEASWLSDGLVRVCLDSAIERRRVLVLSRPRPAAPTECQLQKERHLDGAPERQGWEACGVLGCQGD